MWFNVRLIEFTHYRRGNGRTHQQSRILTKSSTIAIKSKVISLLLAVHTLSALTHTCTCIHMLKTDSWTIIYCIIVIGLKALKETLKETNDIPGVHPPHTWAKCASTRSVKPLTEIILASEILRKIYFWGKYGAKDIQKGTALLICSYQFAPSCRRRMPQRAALHL